MARRDPLAKLQEHLTGRTSSDAEAPGASGQQVQQAEPSNTDQTPQGDWSSLVKPLDEIKSNTVEILTNLQAHSLQIKDVLAQIQGTLKEFVQVVTEGGDDKRTYYTPKEFAEKLMKEGIKTFKGGVKGGERRVRWWCNHKRIKADRRPSGRGEHGEWMIPHAEYVRYKNFGLLRLPKD
jgi:hypothetical protein